VTGERVLSFHNVSVGETADPDLSGQYGRGKIPPWIPYCSAKLLLLIPIYYTTLI